MSKEPKISDLSNGYGSDQASSDGRKDVPTELMDLGERIWTAVLIRGVDTSVQITGKSAKSLARYRKGGEPPLGVIAHLAEATGLSVGWLVTGRVATVADADAAIATFERGLTEVDGTTSNQGEHLALLRHQIEIAERQRELLQRISGQEHDAPAFRELGEVQTLPAEFRLIPRLDVHAAAGAGALVEHENHREMVAFRADWLRQRGINPLFANVLTARGDSMEPTIRDGDILLVDTSIDSVIDNAIYVVVFDGRTLVKRVQLRRDGSVVLKSDNSAIFDEEAVPAAEVPSLNIAGRVKWYGRSI